MTNSTGSIPSDPGVVDVCIPNINRAERVKRLRFGLITAAVSLGILAVLMIFHVDRWWRLALFPLFAGAATGYFQWRDRT